MLYEWESINVVKFDCERVIGVLSCVNDKKGGNCWQFSWFFSSSLICMLRFTIQSLVKQTITWGMVDPSRITIMCIWNDNEWTWHLQWVNLVEFMDFIQFYKVLLESIGVYWENVWNIGYWFSLNARFGLNYWSRLESKVIKYLNWNFICSDGKEDAWLGINKEVFHCLLNTSGNTAQSNGWWYNTQFPRISTEI